MIKKRKKMLPQKRHFFPLSQSSKTTIGLFCLFFLLGTLLAHFLKDGLCNDLLHLFSAFLKKITSFEIDRRSFFSYCFREHTRFYLLLVFFAFTNVWRFYSIAAIAYTGLSNGVLFLFCIIVKGNSGILQYFGFLFPHCLLLLPFYLYTLHHLTMFHDEWFANDTLSNASASHLPIKKGQLFLSQLPLFFLSIVLLAFCSFLESYVNLSLLSQLGA